jgi:hypothetical protein
VSASSKLVTETLRVMREGRLSSEEVLRRSLRANPELKHWLEGRLARSGSQDLHIPQLKRRRAMPEETRAKVLAAARRNFLKRKDIVGVSWGVKYTGGLPREADSLVVWVRQKKPPREVRSFIEGPFQTNVGGRRLSVSLDVQEVPRGEKQWSPPVRPAYRTAVQVGARVGTLSAVFDTGDIYFSGHVAGVEGLPVIVRLPGGRSVSAGRVRACRDDGEVDGARAGPLPVEDIARATRAPVGVRTLGSSEHDIGVRVVCVDGERTTWIDALDAPADFGTGGRMRSLIRLAGKVTSPGDSGAAVLDHAGRLLGFVVGASNEKTMVIPARRVFDAME